MGDLDPPLIVDHQIFILVWCFTVYSDALYKTLHVAFAGVRGLANAALSASHTNSRKS